MRARFVLAAVLAGLALAAGPAAAAMESGQAPAAKLLDLNLEELSNLRVNVSIASRSPESFLKTPAAVWVLPGEAIRRSGATTIAEALRLVPGLIVAQTGSNQWA